VNSGDGFPATGRGSKINLTLWAAPKIKSVALVVVADPLSLEELLPMAAAVTSTGLAKSAPLYSRIRMSGYIARREGHGDDVSICSRCSYILGAVDGLCVTRGYRQQITGTGTCPVGKRLKISDSVQSVGFQAGVVLSAGTLFPLGKVQDLAGQQVR